MKKKTKTENDTKDIKDECGMGTLKEKYQEKKDKRKNEINEAGSQEGQREKKMRFIMCLARHPRLTVWRQAGGARGQDTLKMSETVPHFIFLAGLSGAGTIPGEPLSLALSSAW